MSLKFVGRLRFCDQVCQTGRQLDLVTGNFSMSAAKWRQTPVGRAGRRFRLRRRLGPQIDAAFAPQSRNQRRIQWVRAKNMPMRVPHRIYRHIAEAAKFDHNKNACLEDAVLARHE